MRTVSEEEAKQKYGIEERDDDEIYLTLFGSPHVFDWDWKTQAKVDSDSEGDFLAKLDRMLEPHGLEVVYVKCSGPFIWLIEKKG